MPKRVRYELKRMICRDQPVCARCGHIIDVGQMLPRECPILSLSSPFTNSKSVMEYEQTGICEDCQKNECRVEY